MSKSELGAARHVKALGIGIFPYFWKVSLVGNLREHKFSEKKFIIRYDLNCIPIAGAETLSLGDVCIFNQRFAQKALFPHESLDLRGDRYMIFAFVELNGKNCRGIFCAIGEGNNIEHASTAIQRDGSTLLLFWPESLEKIN